MQPIEAEGLRIDQVVESFGPTYPPEMLLPELRAELLDEHRDWLEPHFLDRASGLLGMSFHSFVIRTESHTILVDGCVGDAKERPAFPAWHQQRTPYLERLRLCGLAPEDIDYVFCTHLHPDHVGWNTRLEGGHWVPTFPNAEYLFARDEWEHWSAYAVADSDPEAIYPPPVREVMRACYRDSVSPVVAAGQSRLVEDGHELAAGIWIESAPGHTPGNAVLNLELPSFRAVLSGDVVHHPLQIVDPTLSSAFCFDASLARTTRSSFLEAHREKGSLVLPAHFPGPTAIVLDDSQRGFRFRGED
jgi:glyoxylase-like metal-dependent hydrolase (beta-lactamase superfamily II)